MIKAPWTVQQVENLNRFQRFPPVHPFTCGRDHDGERVLVATTAGWICSDPTCGYTQDWAHGPMLDFDAETETRITGRMNDLLAKAEPAGGGHG